MARPRRDNLSPLQRRLQWVFDTYAKRSPLVPIYTVMVVKGVFDPSYLAPRGGIYPTVLIAAVTQEGLLSPGTSGRTLLQAEKAVLDGRLTQEDVDVALLRNQPLPSTIGAAIRLLVAKARLWAMTDETFQRAPSNCDKLVPAYARWVAEVVATRSPLTGVSLEDDLEDRWDHYLAHTTRRGWWPEDAMEKIERMYQGGAGRYVCDWFLGARPNLADYHTFDEALYAARTWHASLGGHKLAVEDAKLVYQWPDGWTVQELLQRSHFRQEGDALHHCIGESSSYFDKMASGSSRFFSLRRPDGTPWFTMEVTANEGPPSYWQPPVVPSDAIVEQIKGCKNRQPGVSAQSADCPRPDPSEATRIWDFLAATPWRLGADYQSAWALTVRLLGYGLEKTSVKGFKAKDLVRPPAPFRVPEGKLVADIAPRWWFR